MADFVWHNGAMDPASALSMVETTPFRVGGEDVSIIGHFYINYYDTSSFCIIFSIGFIIHIAKYFPVNIFW
jgi:hypothetical protein